MKSLSLVLKVMLGLLAAHSVSQATPNGLPDVADFEPQEGYSPGPLDGQQGWNVEQGAAVVVEGSAPSGDHSLILAVNDPATRVVKGFTHPAGENIIYVDFFARLAVRPFPEISSLGAGEGTWLVLLPEGGSGKLYAINGDGQGGGEWQSLGVTLPLLADGRSGQWIRITARLDYSTATTDIFIDGELKGMGLGFLGSSNDGFTRLALEGSELADTGADDIYIGWENPLFDDAFNDGIDSGWKEVHGLPLDRAVRDEDPDGDGLTNIVEYFFGTHPGRSDTSRDGLLDGETISLDLDPLTANNLLPVELPFEDDFEYWPHGSIHGRGGWHIHPGGSGDVQTSAVFSGNQALSLGTEDAASTATVQVVPHEENIVWTDFRIRPTRRTDPGHPEISPEAGVAVYFDGNADLVVFDGAAQEWLVIPVSLEPENLDWIRLTAEKNYTAQTWSLWYENVRVARDIGFARSREGLTFFQVSQPGGAGRAYLDDLTIGFDEPGGLDNDGDGLSNAVERLLGSDPDSPDSSQDGMWDGEKVLWGFDPTIQHPFARLDAAHTWEAGFEAWEGFSLGALHGQADWNASPEAHVIAGGSEGTQSVEIPAHVDSEVPAHYAERFFGLEDEPVVWVTFDAKLRSGNLPSPDSLSDPTSALVAANTSGYLYGFDGSRRKWVNSGYKLESPEEWRRLDFYLDHPNGKWSLCVDKVLVLRDLGFRDARPTFARLRFAGATESDKSSALDHVRLSVEEPEGLDFAGDGLTNAVKRALGLDLYSTDTTGDGIPDWWLVEYGFNALDPNIGDTDPYGTGLTVRQNFLLGTRPDLSDTDGDGWSDLDEYLAGTDPLDPASAPDSDGLGDWTIARIGTGLEPYAFKVEDEYRLLGSGYGTAGEKDGFTFVYQEVSGNFEAIARVRAPEYLELGPSGTASWLAQNGLMARPALDKGAPYSAVFTSPLWYWSRFRELPGGMSIGLTHEPVLAGAPKYLRMRRIGNRFRHYLSDDGETWFLVSEAVVSMPKNILLGLFASAHSNDLWVRAPLTDVEVLELSDQAEWHTDDDGGMTFDSFVWLGEWNGEGEHDETGLILRQPSLNELYEVGIAAPAVLELAGAEAVSTAGEWETNGGSIACLERRGWVEFELTVAESDVFLIEVEGREHNRSRQAGSSFDLKLYLDDEYLGPRVLEATPDTSGSIYAFTPWLNPGNHRLRILWDGARSRTHLKLDAVRIRKVAGADGNGNGIKDWVDERVAQHVGIDPSVPAFTYVSPLFLEGRDRFNTLMVGAVEPQTGTAFGQLRKYARPFGEHSRGELGIDFSVQREPYSLDGEPVFVPDVSHTLPNDPGQWEQYISGWAESTEFRPDRGPGYRFWQDIPLAPLVDNELTLSWQNGVAEERRIVRWIPYNLLEGGNMALRVGDSLLLTASEGAHQGGEVVIEIDEEVFETTPASPLVYTFTDPGEYSVYGTYTDPNGQQAFGNLQISVREFAFPDRPLAYVGRVRSWETGEGTPDMPLFEADSRLRLEASNDGFLTFDSEDNDRRIIVARSADDGAIYDSVEVESFRLFSSWETYVQVVDTLPDGTKLVEMLMILSPVPDDVKVRLEIFVGGILFDDGTLERTLLPEDFDELDLV